MRELQEFVVDASLEPTPHVFYKNDMFVYPELLEFSGNKVGNGECFHVLEHAQLLM